MGVGRTDIKEKKQTKDVMVASKQQTAAVNTNVQEVSTQSSQETRNIDMVCESVKLAMPNVYDKLDKMRQGEGEAQGEKTLHHARGTQLLKEGKNVLNMDMIANSFREEQKSRTQVRSDQQNFKLKYNIPDYIEEKGEKKKRDIEGAKSRLYIYVTTYLGSLFESWQGPGEAADVHILLSGNAQAGAATVESAMMVKYWVYKNYPDYVKYLKFEITQYNPSMSQEESSKHADIDLSGNETYDFDGKGAMELGGNAETTVIYSLSDAQSSVPQVVKGAKRLILTSLDSKVGLDALNQPVKEGEQKAVYTDARTGETYRGSGLNELEEGVYLLDQNRTLIRVNTPEQAMFLLADMEEQAGAQKDRMKLLTELVKSWFAAKTPVEVAAAVEERTRLAGHKRTKKKDGQTVRIDDSQLMLDVKNRLMELQNHLAMSVKTNDPQAELLNIRTQYEELINSCETYESNKHPFTSTGRERKKLVIAVRKRAERVLEHLRKDQEIESLKQQASEVQDRTISWNLLLYRAGALEAEKTASDVIKQEEQKQTIQGKKKNRLSMQGIKFVRHSDVWKSDEDKSRRLQHSRLWAQCLLDIGKLPTETNEEKRKDLGKVLDSIMPYLSVDLARSSVHDSDPFFKDARKSLAEYLQKYPQEQERMRQYSSYFLAKVDGTLPKGLLQDNKEEGAESIDATVNEEEMLVGKRDKENRTIKWVDATDEPLFRHEPSMKDVHQGHLGDCYYMGAVASLAEQDPAKIKECMRDNGDGTVTVRFFKPKGSKFCPLYVTVRKSVARFEGSDKDAFAQGRHLWVQMMEKAFAASGLAEIVRKKDYKSYKPENDTYKDPKFNQMYQDCKEYVKNHATDGISDRKLIREKALALMKKTCALVDMGGTGASVLSFLTGKYAEQTVIEGFRMQTPASWDWLARGDMRRYYPNFGYEGHEKVYVAKNLMREIMKPMIDSVFNYRKSKVTLEEIQTAITDVVAQIQKDPGKKKSLMMVTRQEMAKYEDLKQRDRMGENVLSSYDIGSFMRENNKGAQKDPQQDLQQDFQLDLQQDSRQDSKQMELVPIATMEMVDEVLKDFADNFMNMMNKQGYSHEAYSTREDQSGKTVGNYTRDTEKIYQRIERTLRRKEIVTAGSVSPFSSEDYGESGKKEKKEETVKEWKGHALEGLVTGHEYSVIGCQEEGGYKYLLLRNPWGEKSTKTVKVTDAEGKETIRHYKASASEGTDGVFYLELNEFMKYFGSVYVTNA